ncbi:DMT family transporter [Actinoplanes solisilvae]|uniref:DMT family transporter n=1 Tax=Actinoplanes solisilvae TaxID=2486853 RepID=UPI000FDBD348|nr:DMT family transporter [Actinoplanes solisilvae]
MVSVILGLLSALLFAASATLQQHAAHGAAVAAPAPTKQTGVAVALPVVRTARKLIRDRVWLLGTAANVAGSLVQAAALYFGSVAVVQVVLVSQLIFTLWLSAHWDRRRPSVMELGSAIAICAGIAIFLSVPGTAPQAGDANRGRVLIATFCAAALVGVLVLVSAGRHHKVRAVPIAIAAGVFFAISAALLKITTDELFHEGVAATATDWPGYVLIVANVSGFILEQDAFATGTLPPAVTAMTITNPVVSYIVGVLAFHAHFPSSIGGLAALAGASVLVILGVAGLAHSPAVMRHKAPT